MEVVNKQMQLQAALVRFFSHRIWNKPPASVVEASCIMEASSINSFKKRLDDWSKNVEL